MVSEILCDYLSKPETDYAILLTGKWGSGKTYYWKNTLQKVLASSSYDQHIYVPLYGINTVEELGKQILFSQFGLEDKKESVDTATEVAKVLLNAITHIPGIGKIMPRPGSSSKIDFSKLIRINPKTTFLCFDDLERCSLDLSATLGFINKLVEHDHMKILIICDEDRIDGDDKKTYEAYKEKLIGRTIRFSLDDKQLASALDSMISLHANDENYYQFLRDQTEMIIDVFRRSEFENLRTLKNALSDYKRIFRVLDKSQQQCTTILDLAKSYLWYTLALSFEYKANALSEEQLKDLTYENWIRDQLFRNTDSNKPVFGTADNEKHKEESYPIAFRRKYYLTSSHDQIQSPAIVQYLSKGFFDESAFDSEITSIILRQNLSPFEQLMRFRYMNDEDFEEVLQTVLGTASRGELDLRLYPALFELLEGLAKFGLIDQDLEAKAEGLLKGMEIAAKHTAKHFSPRDLELNSISVDKRSKEYEQILERTLELNRQVHDKHEQASADELLKLAGSKPKTFLKELYSLVKNPGYPVFKYLPPEALACGMESWPNSVLADFGDMLKARYELHGIGDSLSQETTNLRELAQLMGKYKATLNVGLRIRLYLINDIELTLQQALNKSQSTR